MAAGPEWLPSPDPNTVASLIKDGLEHLPADVMKAAPGVLASTEPTTLVLGTIVGTLAEEKTIEYASNLDHRLQEYIDDHEDDNAVAVKLAAGVSHLLPDGRELNQAALQAARGDPEALREKLQEYHEDEQLRADLNGAVQQLLTGDFDDLEETLSDAFDTNDTDAAQALLFDFMEIIRTRQTQQTLETVLELDSQFDTLSDDLDNMQEELEHNIQQGLIEADLRDEGFRRLSPLTFDREIENPERAWRARFDFVHVREGFAIDRTRPDGTNVTTDLFDTLHSAETGTTRLVRGPAGSGKSTICKQVACRWYDSPETGPVFYRESGRGGRDFESVGKLKSAVRASPGHALIILEDAIRPATDDIYDLIEEFQQTDIAVSVLLDARQGELDDFEDPTGMETGASDALRDVLGNIERYDVPALDPDDPGECQRIVDTFAAKTGRQVTHSTEYIHREVITSNAELGDLLYLTYFLPVGGEEATGLEGDVRAKYRTVLNPADEKSQHEELSRFDADLLRDVALLVNVLNASRIGIHPALVHALPGSVDVHNNDRETHKEIQRIRTALGDWMLYRQTDPESPIQQTTHELWSALYLRQVALRYEEYGDEGFDRGAKERFEDCINAVLRLPDDENVRQTIRDGVTNSTLLDTLDEDPEQWAEEVVGHIFKLGERQPILAPLYGTSEESGIVLPGVCSTETERQVTVGRGHIHIEYGAYERARTAYTMARERSEELGDRAGIANSLNNLGLVAQQQGDYEAAREYHEDSLELKEELGDRAGIATSLNNLGLVARNQGDYEAAREYFERCVRTFIEIGADRRALTALDNLVSVCEDLSRTDEARQWCETALELIEESDIPELDSEAATYDARRILLSDGDASEQITDLHFYACVHVLQRKASMALDLFEEAWRLRADSSPDESAYRVALASGLAVAVHTQIFDEYDAGGETDEIRTEATDHSNDLTESAQALLALLTDEQTGPGPDELRELADSDEFSEARALEAHAFAVLIESASSNPEGRSNPE